MRYICQRETARFTFRVKQNMVKNVYILTGKSESALKGKFLHLDETLMNHSQ